MVLLTAAVFSETKIPLARITDSLRRKIALEVLRVSPVNTVVSSFFIRFPLCKLAGVANGNSKVELMGALGFGSTDMISDCYRKVSHHIEFMRNVELLFATKIFYDENLEIDRRFIENATWTSGLRVEKVGFKYPISACNFINRWVETDMLKRVTNIIDSDDISPDTSLVVLNAVHFKGTWEVPFHSKLTMEKNFRSLNGSLWKVPMMVSMCEAMYADNENLDLKLISLPFVDSTILFVMPNNHDGLSKLIKDIYDDPNLIRKLKTQMKRKMINISIPKFKIKSYVDWTGFLQLIGVKQVFDNFHSGLKGMLKNNSNGPVHLSKVKQKVFLELDELGAMRNRQEDEAQALEQIEENIQFQEEVLIDRPFYFVISFREHNGREYDLFNGAYYGPQAI